MPKFHVATGTIEVTNLEKVLARGSRDALNDAIRGQPPGTVWSVEVFDFAFTKESVCLFAENAQKPIETLKLRLNDKGQVRVVE